MNERWEGKYVNGLMAKEKEENKKWMDM